MNICDKKDIGSGEEALSADRSCDPLHFMRALGKTISNNIDALKEAKNKIESEVIRGKHGGGVTNCAEFINFVEQRRFAQLL